MRHSGSRCVARGGAVGLLTAAVVGTRVTHGNREAPQRVILMVHW